MGQTVSRAEFDELEQKYNTLLEKLDTDSGVTRKNHKTQLGVTVGAASYRLESTTVSAKNKKGFTLLVRVDGRSLQLAPGRSIVVSEITVEMNRLKERGLLTITAL